VIPGFFSFVCHTKEKQARLPDRQEKSPRMKKTGLALVAQPIANRAVRPGFPRHPWTSHRTQRFF